jgi:tetratricopeptide (TPR) repeat protein
LECFDEKTARQYSLGRLSGRSVVAVEAHLGACRRCLDFVSRATLDSVGSSTSAETIEAGSVPSAVPAAPMPVGRIGHYELIDQLGEGGMGVVYRARDLRTGLCVALKRVRAARPAALGALRREIHALSRLEHPGIVRILEQHVGADRLPFYAMELVEGETLQARMAALSRKVGAARRFADLIPVLRIVERLCGTLAYLHGQGAVHRDLKPRNVLLRADDTPVLVDFGLATHLTELGRDATEVGLRAGTPTYMAPEQLEGGVVDARADLYALGCILYEIFTGRAPVEAKDPEQVLGALAPPPASRFLPDLPPAIGEVLMRLLSHDPHGRPGFAVDVARLLRQHGAAGEGPPPSKPTRLYLYRPALSGRRAELAALGEQVQQCLHGRGGRAFLAGESGIGKTRLAVEVATQAKRLGLRVVMGTGAVLDADRSYEEGAAVAGTLHAFRPLLQLVADHCHQIGKGDVDALVGARAKILAAVQPALLWVPGIDRFPEPPPLSVDAARFRLLEALKETLGAFADRSPMLLVLDDLQWADDLSMAFLDSLDADFFAAHPVLLLCTYRSEEISPARRTRLQALSGQHHALLRLDRAAVTQVVADMLALPEAPAAMSAFLASHSDGNPFFVAEYLRTALEEGWLTRDEQGRWRLADKGDLALARAEDLPTPPSLSALIQRRIDLLGGPARAAVELAAVLGRMFDPDLLKAGAGSEDSAEALDELLARQVLEEAGGGDVRFIHDKLRETTYARLDGTRRRELHLTAARALEAAGVSAGGATDPRAAAVLAHHYEQAGLVEEERRHRRLAGERAFAVGDYHEAIAHLRRSLELCDGAQDPVEVSTLERHLAESYFGAGDMAKSRKHIEALVARLGIPMPRTRGGRLLGVLADLGRFLLRRPGLEYLPAPLPQRRAALIQAARAYERLAHVLFFENETLGVVASSLRGLGAAIRVGPSSELARVYANLSLSLGLVPLHVVAPMFRRWASEMAVEIGDESAAAWADHLDGVYRAGLGQWEAARREFEAGLQFWNKAGDRRRYEESLTLLGMVLFHAGDPSRAAELRRTLESSAADSGSVQSLGWALVGQGEDRLLEGDVPAALSVLERAAALGPEVRTVEDIWCKGLLARAQLAAGQSELARTSADRALALMQDTLPTAFYALEGYAATAAVYLDLLRDVVDQTLRRELRSRARRALRAVRSFARVFPIGRPRAALLVGRWHCLNGRISLGRALWTDGVPTARSLGRRLDEGFLARELALTEPGGCDERALELARGMLVAAGSPTGIPAL